MPPSLAHHDIKVLASTAPEEEPGTAPRPEIFYRIAVIIQLFHGNEVDIVPANVADEVVHWVDL